MVNFWSFSPSSTTTSQPLTLPSPSPSTLPTSPIILAMSPSPLLRDVGYVNTTLVPSEVRMTNTTAPSEARMQPSHWMEELGRQEQKGGPMKWEAHLVCHENGPQPLSWPVFFPLFLFHPATDLKPCNNMYQWREDNPCQDVRNQMTAYNEMDRPNEGKLNSAASRTQQRQVKINYGK